MLIEIVIENEFCPFSSTANLHYEKFSDGTEKCVENEIHFEIPSSWMFCRLGDLFTVCSSKRVLQSEWKDSGIPFYRAREIVKLSDNDSVDNELFISEDHYQKLAKEYGVPLSGDLMVSGVGTIGKTYIVKDTDKFYYKDASVLCFQNRTGCINSSYAKYLLESTFMQSQMHNFSKGSTVDTITISTAVRYLCILPPVKEQERIVATINNLLSLNNCIDYELNNLKALVTNAKSKILDLAIRGKLVPQDPNDEPASILLEHIRKEKEELIKSGKLKRDKRESVIFRGDDNSYYEKFGDGTIKCIAGEIPFVLPPGWCWERLGNVSSIARGGSPRPIDDYLTDSPEGVNWIKISDTEKDGKFIHNTKEKIKPEGVPKSRFVRNGDFLLTNSMSFGRPYILKTDGCIHDGWLVIGEIDKIFNQDFLYYGLSSQFMFSELSKVAAGSTVQNLKSDTVKNVLFPIPPLKEQKCISERIIELFSILSAVEVSLS